jgi:hypothetical protein
MQKNQERTGGYLIFWKTNPILENCGNISGFQFFDFGESQLRTLRITLIIVRVSVSDNYPITLVKTSAWSPLYPHEEPPVLVQKKWIKTISVLLPTCKWNPQSSFGSGLILIFLNSGFGFENQSHWFPIWFLLTQIKTQQLTISQPLVFITFFFCQKSHLSSNSGSTPKYNWEPDSS